MITKIPHPLATGQQVRAVGVLAGAHREHGFQFSAGAGGPATVTVGEMEISVF